MRKRVDVRIELRRSTISGIGVFAVRKITPGEKIADGITREDYKQLVPWIALKKYGKDFCKKVMDFCVGTPIGFIPPEDLDFNRLSVEWYINHSCEGNVGFDANGDFIAIDAILSGAELTYDYGLAESNPRFRMKCRCGKRKCRRIITGNDWRQRAYQLASSRFMLPSLRKMVESKSKPNS